MPEVSTLRRNLLRAMYLLILVGQGFTLWPRLLHHSDAWALRFGDTQAILAGLSVMAILGLRHPLGMVPVLLFELAWKLLWLGTIAFPLWRSGAIDAATRESLFAVGLGVVLVPLVLPWTYVWRRFVRGPGEPWR